MNTYFEVRGAKSPYTTKDIVFEYATLILIVPLALTFYLMLQYGWHRLFFIDWVSIFYDNHDYPPLWTL